MAGSLYILHHPEDTAATAELIGSAFPEAVTARSAPPGKDAGEFVREAIASADYVIILVGPRWIEHLRSETEGGTGTLAVEVAAAFDKPRQKVHVLLTEGAKYFTRAELPQPVQVLLHLPVSTLKPERAQAYLDELRQTLDRLVRERLSPPAPQAEAAPGSSRASNIGASLANEPKPPELVSRSSATRVSPAPAAPWEPIPRASARSGSASPTQTASPAEAAAAAAGEKSRASFERALVGRSPRLSPEEMSHSVAESRRAAPSGRAAPRNPPPAPSKPPGFFSRLFGLRREQQVDTVDCSVFSVPRASPGATVLVQVFLHVPEHAERVQGLASLMDSSTTLKGAQTLDIDVARGSRVTVSLSAPGLEIDEPQQTVRWRGNPVFCQFQLTIPAGSPARTHRPVVRVAVDGGLVGRIVFELLAYPQASSADRALQGQSRRYERAFLSYASADRKEVLKRAQVLQAAGVSFFQDILSLDPGARWEKEIYRHIDECDVFLLFWSRAAKASEWVVKEAEYALARQKDGLVPDIVPVILETPAPLPPPPSLAHLHFNDRVHYLIATS